MTVITDSSACLPPDLAAELRIAVLPIRIHLPGRDLQDGEPGASPAVYRAVRRGEAVKSSAPTALDYLAAVDDADGSAAVVLTPAAEFTTMRRSAGVAAELASRPVTVVDTRTAAAAHGLVVLAAATVAADGGSAEDVLAAAEDASRRVDLVASLENVEFVRRSGRVPPAALGLASWLGVRPVFRLAGGSVERIALPSGEESALRRIRSEWAVRGGPEAERAAVFHAEASDGAERLLDLLETHGLVTEFSASMGIHTGPGLVGVAWLRSPG